MQIDRRLIAHFDWTLLALTLGITAIGVLTIYSATYRGTEGANGLLAMKQLYWLGLGLFLMICFFVFDYRYIEKLAYPFFAVIFLLLLLVDAMGAVGGGSQRWLQIAGFTLQPSEPAKLALVWMLAKHFRHDEPPGGYRLRDLWLPLALTGPLALVILLQPDLGTAIIVFLVCISVLLMGGLRLRTFILMTLLGMATLPAAWRFLKPYQQNRILTFLNPDLDPLGAGYHVIQSKIAIGSGGFFGKGYLQGTQNRLDFLPAQHTDFVFAVFGEEWGFVGCLILIVLYAAFLFYSLRVVARAKDRFGAILGFGMIAIFFWQIVINISMVTGVMPVVGITLPLLSYGGSSLVTMMIAVGILLNIGMRRFTF